MLRTFVLTNELEYLCIERLASRDLFCSAIVKKFSVIKWDDGWLGCCFGESQNFWGTAAKKRLIRFKRAGATSFILMFYCSEVMRRTLWVHWAINGLISDYTKNS